MSAADLKHVGILDSFSPEELEELSHRCTRVHFEAGERVFRQDDAGDALYFLLDGEIEVRKAGAGGIERRLAVLPPGMILGEMSLVAGEPRTASAVCTKEGDALRLSRDQFEGWVAEGRPGAARFLRLLAKVLSQRLEASNKRAIQLAPYDGQTGLPNRILLNDRLDVALAEAKRHARLVAVLVVDLDAGSSAAVGPDVGALLIKAAAGRLQAALSENETLARIGSATLAVLLPGLLNAQAALQATHRLLYSLSVPIILDDEEHAVGCNIGVSLYPTDADDPAGLVKNAELAAARARRMGPHAFHFYSVHMEDRPVDRIALADDLRTALGRRQLRLHYQPQLDLATQRLAGLEALIRWDHPDVGLVSPGAFLPLAVETGLMGAIGEWVVRTACAQFRDWQDAGLGTVRLAVNLAAPHFRQQNMAEMLARVLKEHDVPPSQIVVEVTESVFLQSPDFTMRTLQELSDLGIQAVLDDFGTGYSSLSYLKRLPITAVKLDDSFVSAVGEPRDAALATAIIAMAHSLGLRVIAEGVATPEQLEFLSQRGCDEVQGFLFSGALPAAELEPLLRDPGRLSRLSP